MTAGLIALVVLALQEPVTDSAAVIRQAERLIVEYYGGMRPDPEPCNGVFFGDCSAGEWRWPYNMKREHQSEARADLIRELEAVSRSAGNSEWLYRQRVAFSIRHGNYPRAAQIASACDATASWCWMLKGLTSHLLAPGTGMAEFDSAFALADRDHAGDASAFSACTWADPRDLLPVEQMRDAQQNWSCPQSHTLFARFWWLSDPLWSVEGNTRYAEHLARHVMIRMDRDLQSILDRAAVEMETLDRFRNPDSTYSYAIRQGFPNSRSGGISEVCPVRACAVEPNPAERISVVGYDVVSAAYVRGGYSFTPSARVLADPARSSSEDWTVTWLGVGCRPPWTAEVCGAERMVPARVWHNLDHQTAVFRHGSQLLIASAAHVPDSIGRSASLRSALAVGKVEAMDTKVFLGAIDSARVLRATALVDTGRSYLGSIEVVSPDHVGRARFGLRPSELVNGFGVSDVAVVESRTGLDESVERMLLPSLRLPAGQPVGIYFEIYGLAADETVEVSLGTHRMDASWLSRVARWLSLQSEVTPVSAQWREEADRSSGALSRYYTVDTRTLSRGEHRVVVTVTRRDGTEATASRTILLR